MVSIHISDNAGLHMNRQGVSSATTFSFNPRGFATSMTDDLSHTTYYDNLNQGKQTGQRELLSAPQLTNGAPDGSEQVTTAGLKLVAQLLRQEDAPAGQDRAPRLGGRPDARRGVRLQRPQGVRRRDAADEGGRSDQRPQVQRRGRHDVQAAEEDRRRDVRETVTVQRSY